MIRPTAVEPREGFRIWLRYSDGVSGELDLSHLAGRGVFAAWDEPGCFERVHVAPHRAIAWSDELELCPDALYMDLTGKSLDELPTDAEAPVTDARDQPLLRHRDPHVRTRPRAAAHTRGLRGTRSRP